MSHPRFNKAVLGYESIWQDVVAAEQSGQVPHAMLLTGNKGIGKASFAYKLAKYLLSRNHGNMDHDRMVENQAHPDLFVLSDTDEEEMVKEIKVERVRELLAFARHGSVYDGYKVIIIDSVDSLNRFGANALLKLLEEPNEKTIFLLVCHHLSAALPTIRSRCRIIKFPQLDFASYQSLMKDVETVDLEALYKITKGSVAYSIKLASDGVWSDIESLLMLSTLSDAEITRIVAKLSNKFDLQLFAYILEYICDTEFYKNSKNVEKVENIHKVKSWIHDQLKKIDVFNLEKFAGYMHIVSELKGKLV